MIGIEPVFTVILISFYYWIDLVRVNSRYKAFFVNHR